MIITPSCCSLERNESGRMGGTDPRPTMLDRFVTDREFCEIVTDHFGLDFDLVESLSVVDADNAPNHLRNDDHAAEMCPDWLWLLTRRSFLFLEMAGFTCKKSMTPTTK